MNRFFSIVSGFLLLFLSTFFISCGSVQDDLQGNWKLSVAFDGYENWRISNDTVYINEGLLFERRGLLTEDENGEVFVTTSDGIFKLPKDQIEAGTVDLEAQPGTTDLYQMQLKREAGKPSNNYFLSVCNPQNRPKMKSAKTVPNKKAGWFFMSKPRTKTTQFSVPEYSFQLGREDIEASLIDIEGYLAQTDASGKSGVQSTAMLHIDESTAMKHVYAITDELRRTMHYQVVYVSETGHVGNQVHGIERNLFLYSLPDEMRYNDPKVDLKAMKVLLNRRTDFYDRLFSDELLYVLKVDSANRTTFNGELLEGKALEEKVSTLLKNSEQEERKPVILVIADENATYGAYITALDLVVHQSDMARDVFCKNAFGTTYDEALKRTDANDVRRFVQSKYPGKIIEITPTVYDFYAPVK